MVESDGFDLTYFINSQLKFINQAIKGLFDYVDKKQNEQSNALDLLSAYLADGKLNSRQAMIIYRISRFFVLSFLESVSPGK
jgi:hypothetical protein